MIWIDGHRRVDEGVTVGNCRTYHLLFANDLVLLATYQHVLQKALGRFSAAHIQAGTNVSKDAQSSVLCKWVAIHCNR